MNLYKAYKQLKEEGKDWDAANLYLEWCEKHGISFDSFAESIVIYQMENEEEQAMLKAKARRLLAQ